MFASVHRNVNVLIEAGGYYSKNTVVCMVTQGHWKYTRPKYAAILYRFRDITEYSLIIARFLDPTSIWHPVGGDCTGVSPNDLPTEN